MCVHLRCSGESNMQVMTNLLFNICKVCERAPNFNLILCDTPSQMHSRASVRKIDERGSF